MPCGSFRVDGIVLAEPSSHRSIRSIDYQDGETGILKLTGQTGPKGAGASNRVDGVGAKKRLAPNDQIVVSLSSGGDSVLTELAAIGGQGDRHVNVLVGVDTDQDVKCSARAGLCQAW
jgi:hypothetical protein